jgi:iron complex transport system substrate-binding protein
VKQVGRAFKSLKLSWFFLSKISTLLLMFLGGSDVLAIERVEARDNKTKPVVAVDDMGNRVQLVSPAKRIVSLAPHLTEILFELGVGDKVIATVSYADFPDAAKLIPRVGDAFSINVEKVVALQPEIIFAWETGGANKSLQRLEKLGFKIFKNEAPSLEGIANTALNMGILVGEAERGRKLSSRYLTALKQLRLSQRASEKTSLDSPLKVFFQISDQDLYTVSDRHLIGQAINLCGAQNLFADVPISVPLANLESVLKGQPNIVFITRLPGGPVSSWEDRWKKLLGSQVQLISIDPNSISRPSLRMLDGIEFLCSAIKSAK